jgi:hypothetical protein
MIKIKKKTLEGRLSIGIPKPFESPDSLRKELGAKPRLKQI